ncbi:MAG: GIY-YIG nuclease family protein [Proteobacteria bacterium]|nr:GIY-YIG nuclease family protein [Pseudomonadota bacterium]
MIKQSYIYILTNRNNSVLYIGVTSSLEKRLFEHRNHLIPGFTSKYHLHKLVYYEQFDHIENAIAREKQLKGKTRAKKEALINSLNPSWSELDSSLCSE